MATVRLWPGAAVPNARPKQTVAKLRISATGCFAEPDPKGSHRPRAATQRSCRQRTFDSTVNHAANWLPQWSSLEVPRLPCRDHRVWLDERAIDLLAFHAKTRWSRTVLGMVSSPPVSRSGVVEITAR